MHTLTWRAEGDEGVGHSEVGKVVAGREFGDTGELDDGLARQAGLPEQLAECEAEARLVGRAVAGEDGAPSLAGAEEFQRNLRGVAGGGLAGAEGFVEVAVEDGDEVGWIESRGRMKKRAGPIAFA